MTTTKSEYLFKKLAREGECWHYWVKGACSVCGEWYGIGDHPDFFSPPSEEQGWIWFGWLWERMKDHDKWGNFGTIFNWDDEIDKSLISCKDLAEALHLWFEGQKGQVIDTRA